MLRIRIPIATLLLLLLTNALSAQLPNQHLLGTWEPVNKEKRVLVEVYESANGKISGKIIGAYDPQGHYRAAPSHKAPLLVHGFSYSEKGTWRHGHITDPEDGKSYSGRITLLAPNQLEVRAYYGIFWKDMKWEKVSPQATVLATK